jgi:hypothetical protein
MSVARDVGSRSARGFADFVIFPDGSGHWCSQKADGTVAGTFFTREAAIRFAKEEGLGLPDFRLGFANTEIGRRA